MTSFAGVSDEFVANLKDDGNVILVVDAEPSESGLSRYTRLVHVTSSRTGACDGDGFTGCERRRLVVLHRKAFDVSSSRNLRVKRAAFSQLLDRLETSLRQELTNARRQCVWPIHCATSGYLHVEERVAGSRQLDDEASDRAKSTASTPCHYARGFLVAFPDADAGSPAMAAQVQAAEDGHKSLSTTQSLRRQIDKILEDHEFQVFLDLVSNSEDNSWTVAGALSRATEADKRLRLVELTDHELTLCNALPPAFVERDNNVIFHEISEVIDVLTQAKQCVDDHGCINELLQYAGEVSVKCSEIDVCTSSSCSFIVVEGLDATGKSTVVKNLVSQLDACQLCSPPPSIQHLRSVFDAKVSVVRRAYYCLGNYMVGQMAQQMTSHRPVVLDRFWHSTAAYAISEESSIPQDSNHWVYRWPRDLFRPTVVILLVVDEELRIQRLQNRVLTEGTAQTQEERNLAVDSRRRQRILEAYRKMKDPEVIEVSADGSPDQVLQRVFDVLRSKNVLKQTIINQ